MAHYKRPHVIYEPAEDVFINVHEAVIGGIVIPAGFRFDGASIPRFLRWWKDRAALGLVATMVHDWLYRHRGKVQGLSLSRKKVDKIFYRDMLRDHVPKRRARIAYIGVRIGGFKAWRD